ncbi:MAG: hypothetical protein HRT36_08535 [Alphaproteobacteria bacterium]|nr:hypothetical protein [Alphaproteobacteria bacterium]
MISAEVLDELFERRVITAAGCALHTGQIVDARPCCGATDAKQSTLKSDKAAKIWLQRKVFGTRMLMVG